MKKVTIGIDGGYSSFKAVSGPTLFQIPSVVGTPSSSRVAVGDSEELIIQTEAMAPVMVGDSAIAKSTFINRPENRGWIRSDAYKALFLATLVRVADFYNERSLEPNIMTGLPVAFFDADESALRTILSGDYDVIVGKTKPYHFNLKPENIAVTMQPFGTAASEGINANLEIIDRDIAFGRTGIVDWGGKTVNLMVIQGFSEIRGSSESAFGAGGWDIVRQLRPRIEDAYPGRQLRDHDAADIIATGRLKYRGRSVKVNEALFSDVLQEAAVQVEALLTQRWNVPSLDAIILTGGGALLAGDRLLDLIDHDNKRIATQPVFANANGYYRLAAFQEKIK